MYTVLEVGQQIINGHSYFRINIPKFKSDQLNLKDHDTITIKIIAVKRNGEIIYQDSHALAIYQAEDGSHAV